jgi:hypothetical protein
VEETLFKNFFKNSFSASTVDLIIIRKLQKNVETGKRDEKIRF